MKILIVSQYYYPEQFQINEIAPELVRRGHKVTVLCGLPNYPKGVIFEGYANNQSVAQREKEYFTQTGVEVVHVRQTPRGNNPLSLIRNYLSFARNSIKVVREFDDDFDIVLGYQLSPITSMFAAREYKRLHGTPLLFYTLDIWPVSALGMLKSKFNPLMWLVAGISKKLYNLADRILVTSRPFADYLHQANSVDPHRIAYLPQHASAAMLELNLDKQNDTGRVDFMFAGNLGKGQRIDVIVKAAVTLGPRTDYRIHLVGDGRMKEQLEKMVKAYGLEDNIIFHGNQRREDMPDFYCMADALLITLRGNNEVGNTMPGKLQMYMTTGKPILGAINGAAKEVIEESGCGKCVGAGDYKGLARIMEDFIMHNEAYTDCGAKARFYFAAHFTLENYINGLETEMFKLTNK